jgi:hypothetical protein
MDNIIESNATYVLNSLGARMWVGMQIELAQLRLTNNQMQQQIVALQQALQLLQAKTPTY